MEKKKIKAVLPSLRPRKRYLAFEILSESKSISFPIVQEELMHDLYRFLGDYGLSFAGINIMPDKYKNNKGIIRINHDYLDHLRAGLALTAKLDNQRAIVSSLGASGMLNKAEKMLQ